MKKMFMAALVAATAMLTACDGSSPRASLKTDVDTLSYELGMVMSPGEQLPYLLAQSGSDSSFVEEYLKGFSEGMKSGADKEKLAYYMGVMQGIQNKMQMKQIEAQVFQGDSTKKVSVKNYLAGHAALVKNKTALKRDGKLVDRETANNDIMAYMFKKQQKESDEFMAKKAKETGVQKLSDGVLYKVITPSSSAERVSATDSVEAKYEGRLIDGTVFDSSEREQGGTRTFSLKSVIKGWQVAIPQMPVGATWEVYVPYSAAYGEKMMGGIPPYSALIFKITLVGKK